MTDDNEGAPLRDDIELDPPALPQAVGEDGQWIIRVDDLSPGDKIVVQVRDGQRNWHPTPGDTLRGCLNERLSENVVYIDTNNIGDGAWDTKFDPAATPDGTYQAAYVKTNEVGDPVRSQSVAVVISGSSAPSYGLTLASLTSGGEPADGNAKNAAQAVVTQSGHGLARPMTVRFVFLDGSARFDTSGPDVQSGSDEHTLDVLTHKDAQGRDIAEARFSDTIAETVTVQACVYRQPGGSSRTQDFVFKPVSTRRYIVTITDRPSSLSDGGSGRVSGTVVDAMSQTVVNGTCHAEYVWPVGGDDSAPVTNGTFHVDVYGEYASGRQARRGAVTVRYGDGHDQAGIYVFPLPPI
ncbi:hypothetical protein [Trinickia diaoshuihuensis]|jgi:hypothetical protein|uniref:hypothetical protein n=1 Tax=Trinickia diaoshuihuensis TaxID=2292265 RepID=UPI000E243A8A|nr:hypothetical protein [Trinickia diaoshuihuensis]